MGKRRFKSGKEMRKEFGCDPTVPQPEDYVTEIKKWLEDGRTQQRVQFSVLQFNVPWSLMIFHPSHRGVEPPSEAAPSKEASDQLDQTEEADIEETVCPPFLNLQIDDEYRLSLSKDVPDEDRYLLLDDLDIFRADSATILKEWLLDFGIDLYCPVAPIGDALPRKPEA